MLETENRTQKSENRIDSSQTVDSSIAQTAKVDGRTMPEAYFRRVELFPQSALIRYPSQGSQITVTWGQFHQKVLNIVSALDKLGIKKGEAVCIFSQTRPEWMMVDYANLVSGRITVPIYHSNTVEDVAYILSHCDGKVIFADDEPSCQKLKEAFEKNGVTVPVITFFRPSDSLGIKAQFFDELLKNSPPTDETESSLKKLALSLNPDDLATIVYTSGTTGQPKGAALTHKNICAELRGVAQEVDIGPTDFTLTFLPMAHVLGRVESLFPVFCGLVINFAESINTVAQDIGKIGPTILISVPRIYEKIYSKIQSEISTQPPFKQKIFAWAVDVGRKVVRLKSEKRFIPIALQAKFKVADALVLGKIRQKLGGRIRYTVSGGAPLALELCEFFHACGIKVLEGYGLTETMAAITVNRPDDYCFGTVGKPLPWAEVKIAADGEILLRGDHVFKGYYKNPEATKEVFLEGGWFCTGDIGEINERGFLKITDRKKELIITAGGKNIAPQKLENALKQCRFISNAMVYGDKQKYIVALIALNEAEISKWAQQEGLSKTGLAELCQADEVKSLIEKSLETINNELASYESIKKFTLLEKDFAVETGELTPSLKLKRKIITKKYQTLIDLMY